MKILSASAMKSMDRQATERYGIPGSILMENAGRESVELIRWLNKGELKNVKVLILAGKGNNGGDGLVIARHLLNQGAKPEVWLMAEGEQLAGDARLNYDILTAMQAPLQTLLTETELSGFTQALLGADLVVDALYGIGFQGQLGELESRVIQLINSASAVVIAIDIPSGLEADSGNSWGEAVRADYTVSFAAPKQGFFQPGAGEYLGQVLIADISIPQALQAEAQFPDALIDTELVKPWLQPRQPMGHKGDYGHLLVIGASAGMSGAVSMTCRAALRSGAGLVTAAVPQSLVGVVDSSAAELMCRGLAETPEITIAAEALPAIEALLGTSSVCAIGPGMSRYREAGTIMQFVLEHTGIPVLIDADGLNSLQDNTNILSRRQVPVVLTPHPGEMARLTGLSIGEIQRQRLKVAREYSQRWGVILVLKGHNTIVSTASGEIYLNPTGNPGMATAGSGDVLSGIISGLMCQGLSPLNATVAGVYIHGRAGDRGAQIKGQRGLVAGDLIDHLPVVLYELESGSDSRTEPLDRFYWL